MIPLEEMGFIPEEDWAYLAQKTDRSVNQAKNDYREGLRRHLTNPRPVRIEERERPQPLPDLYAAQGPSLHKTFDITVVPAVHPRCSAFAAERRSRPRTPKKR